MTAPRLAKRGLVVVSINYRLGVLGYMAHPGLSAESPDGVSGNYGLLDQIEALRWVQTQHRSVRRRPRERNDRRRIRRRPERMYLMTSPRAKGLFSKAVAQSAYMISTAELKQAKFGTPSRKRRSARIVGSQTESRQHRGAARDGCARSERQGCSRLASHLSVRSTGMCCPASWSISSTRANRRACRCWRGSTAARSAL